MKNKYTSNCLSSVLFQMPIIFFACYIFNLASIFISRYLFIGHVQPEIQLIALLLLSGILKQREESPHT